jgi:putative NADH-flavin reductase
MRIAVFGATGRLGREAVRAAVERGHAVAAHSRRPQTTTQSGVEWVTGDPGNAVKGTDAVLVVFGPNAPSDPPFCRAETQSILDAMAKHGVRRILCVTGGMVGDYPGNRTWVFQLLTRYLQKKYTDQMEDRAAQEKLIIASQQLWTIFKPPRLTPKSPARRVIAGPAVRVGLLSSISRGSLARLMVQEAESGQCRGHLVFAKN